MSDTEKTIDAWFEAHFNHITPGTPDHSMLTRARDKLKEMLGITPKPVAAEKSEAAPEVQSTKKGE